MDALSNVIGKSFVKFIIIVIIMISNIITINFIALKPHMCNCCWRETWFIVNQLFTLLVIS